MKNTEEVRDKLKETYRRQNKAYNEWRNKIVGPVPEHLHSPELLNSDLIHCLVKSVDWLLAQREQDEKAKAAMLKEFENVKPLKPLKGVE